MGALLQRVGLQRMPSQALVQVPSADLIRSDNEFSPPEPAEIQLEIEPEKLAEYAQVSKKFNFGKQAVGREKLSHLLKFNNFKVYDELKVDDFMKRYIDYASKNINLGNDIWWEWINLKEYRHPLPSRVVNNIQTIYSSGTDEYSTKNSFLFFVSDIVLVTSRTYDQYKNTSKFIMKSEFVHAKRRTEICFLGVAFDTDTSRRERLIIDAWRGPTFSDEEAKI